jgi:hypothetical protein
MTLWAQEAVSKFVHMRLAMISLLRPRSRSSQCLCSSFPHVRYGKAYSKRLCSAFTQIENGRSRVGVPVLGLKVY